MAVIKPDLLHVAGQCLATMQKRKSTWKLQVLFNVLVVGANGVEPLTYAL